MFENLKKNTKKLMETANVIKNSIKEKQDEHEHQKDVEIVSEMLDIDVAIAKYGEKKGEELNALALQWEQKNEELIKEAENLQNAIDSISDEEIENKKKDLSNRLEENYKFARSIRWKIVGSEFNPFVDPNDEDKIDQKLDFFGGVLKSIGNKKMK